MIEKRSIIRGVGGYLPEKVLTNAELATMVDTTDEWIQQRVGIKERHIAAEGQFTSDLAVEAAKKAMAAAGVTPDDIDLIIVATTTPDYTFPSAATLVQMKLGMHHGIAFDIQAVCSGFVYGVATADSYLKNGLGTRALVIGAETFSRLLDWTDRGTCVLFGDGAGAVVMDLATPEEFAAGRGVLSSALRSDGHHWKKLYVDGGPSSTGTTGHVRMQGAEVFRHAVG
ncbi:MAG: beta-ketoacyl-ACP synthase 3, partial [Devosia sp.]